MESIDKEQNFIPQPIYPLGIDSDYTLYKVHNTTESFLVVDNEAWSEIIYIEGYKNTNLIEDPWPDNGFATIEGELLYYRRVDKDYQTGKVVALKDCIRNIGGKPTRYNLAGVSIRGLVVAEHHNQLAQAIVNIENFIGIDFDEDQKTLDWKIRNLFNTPPIFDDYGCPDVNFSVITLSKDPNSGTVISYNLKITGGYKNFKIDFGDGTSTTNELTGTHLYATSVQIDPVVNVETNNCNIVQTPTIRNNPNEPTLPVAPEPVFIQIPECPALPPLDITIPQVPDAIINLPPIIFPNFDIGIPNINIPSIISVVPPIPSQINFGH